MPSPKTRARARTRTHDRTKPPISEAMTIRVHNALSKLCARNIIIQRVVGKNKPTFIAHMRCIVVDCARPLCSPPIKISVCVYMSVCLHTVATVSLIPLCVLSVPTGDSNSDRGPEYWQNTCTSLPAVGKKFNFHTQSCRSESAKYVCGTSCVARAGCAHTFNVQIIRSGKGSEQNLVAHPL